MKSHVSVLIELAKCIINDATAKSTVKLDLRDIKTIISRVEHEGLSFLTITLPSFGSELERALAEGELGPTRFRSFKKHGRAPVFLRGFLDLVFDRSTGRILNEPIVEAIEAIRQIAYAFKKLKISCTPERERAAINKFVKSEHIFDVALDPGDITYFSDISRVLWSSVLNPDVEFTLGKSAFVPKHGPGATAERISGNQKFVVRNWHDRLEPYFPLFHNAFSSESAYGSREFEGVSIISEDSEQPVRVIPVPKTLKGPRIIAIEPVCMQYAQQAISGELVSLLERHPLTAGHVNFTDQSVNRRLALMSSEDESLATLDLSSASDRVPRSLALHMFDSVPLLRDAIDACRSRRAELPSGEVIPLKKFASMGSALCFPVEAMYFYTICVAALIRQHNLPVDYTSIKQCASKVFVYGDDIIVPADSAGIVADHLHKYYCKVNMSKSFWTGRFRESCGMDAYAGYEVTPTYVRHMPPRDRRKPEALISWVETSNLFYKRGYWTTSDYMIKLVEKQLGKLPVVGEKCAGLGKVSFQRYVSTERYNRRYHVDEVKTWVARPVYRTDTLNGYSALTKCLLKLERPLSPGLESDSKHLSRTARHGAVALQRRWVRPY